MLPIEFDFRNAPSTDELEAPALVNSPTQFLVRFLLRLIPPFAAASLANGAEPAEVQSRTATAGTSIEASATSFGNGVVTLKTTIGTAAPTSGSSAPEPLPETPPPDSGSPLPATTPPMASCCAGPVPLPVTAPENSRLIPVSEADPSRFCRVRLLWP